MNILVTGADRGLGFGIVQRLLERGETVYAGRFLEDWRVLDGLAEKFPDTLTILPLDVGSDESVKTAAETIGKVTARLDVLISNAGISGRPDIEKANLTDTDMMLNVYNVNSVAAVRLVENFLSLLENSVEKKLCFVSSEAGSITQCKRDGFFWYCMTKAALNMYVKILHNKLHSKGYKFRLYHPGWIKSYMGGNLSERGDLSIEQAAQYAVDYFFDQAVDEDVLLMRGYNGEIFNF